jgi:uncharacterized membrane protein
MSSHQQRRNELHDRMTVGQKIADKVASTMGSWPFIIVQSSILACWIVLNAAELIFRPWDPYPFILLNLMLSFQAAYAAPFIMMSQNRQAAKDRSRDDLEAEEVEQLHSQTSDIHRITLDQEDLMLDVHTIADHLGCVLSTPRPPGADGGKAAPTTS